MTPLVQVSVGLFEGSPDHEWKIVEGWIDIDADMSSTCSIYLCRFDGQDIAEETMGHLELKTGKLITRQKIEFPTATTERVHKLLIKYQNAAKAAHAHVLVTSLPEALKLL